MVFMRMRCTGIVVRMNNALLMDERMKGGMKIGSDVKEKKQDEQREARLLRLGRMWEF